TERRRPDSSHGGIWRIRSNSAASETLPALGSRRSHAENPCRVTPIISHSRQTGNRARPRRDEQKRHLGPSVSLAKSTAARFEDLPLLPQHPILPLSSRNRARSPPRSASSWRSQLRERLLAPPQLARQLPRRTPARPHQPDCLAPNSGGDGGLVFAHLRSPSGSSPKASRCQESRVDPNPSPQVPRSGVCRGTERVDDCEGGAGSRLAGCRTRRGAYGGNPPLSGADASTGRGVHVLRDRDRRW